MDLTSYDTGLTFQSVSASTLLSVANINTKNLGVYTFIDENGNVTQIKKEVRRKVLLYPEVEMSMDWVVIGVSDDTVMGISDNPVDMVLANYFPNIKKK